jgi:hypothetical protein
MEYITKEPEGLIFDQVYFCKPIVSLIFSHCSPLNISIILALRNTCKHFYKIIESGGLQCDHFYISTINTRKKYYDYVVKTLPNLKHITFVIHNAIPGDTLVYYSFTIPKAMHKFLNKMGNVTCHIDQNILLTGELILEHHFDKFTFSSCKISYEYVKSAIISNDIGKSFDSYLQKKIMDSLAISGDMVGFEYSLINILEKNLTITALTIEFMNLFMRIVMFKRDTKNLFLPNITSLQIGLYYYNTDAYCDIEEVIKQVIRTMPNTKTLFIKNVRFNISLLNIHHLIQSFGNIDTILLVLKSTDGNIPFIIDYLAKSAMVLNKAITIKLNNVVKYSIIDEPPLPY